MLALITAALLAAPAPASPKAAASPTASPAPAAAPASGIIFIDDDWPGAIARAQREGKLLFVDAWATWCHTCLSMRNFVFPDPGLREVAGRVVWVALDTEKPVNEAFVDSFQLEAWPTFFVVDPKTRRLVDRWAGAATVAELRRFVADAADAYALERSPGPAAAAVDEALSAGNRGDFAAAAAAWKRVVGLTPAGDPARPSRLVSLAMALARARTPEAARKCVGLGLAELASTGDSATATDFTIIVNGCAERLADADPQRRKLVAGSIARLEALVTNPAAPLSVDDRSDAYANLVALLDASGRHDLAVERARARLRLLEDAAAAAPDVEKAATFDAHRVDAYLYFGELAAAEKLLASRERELPGDYNPPARLARVLRQKGDLAAAAAAADRALALAPRGLRRVGILGLKLELLEALGRPTLAVREEQLALYRDLPARQRSARRLADLEAALAAARAREAASAAPAKGADAP